MADPAIRSLVLAGRTLDASVAEAITSMSFAHGLEQAATLTLGLHDPKRTLVKSKIATQRITARVGADVYVLVQVSKNGSDLTLTFEDQVVNALRRVRGALKMKRSSISRAGFARRLCLDPLAAGYLVGAQISFWSPEFARKDGKRKALPKGQPQKAKNKATSSKHVPDTAPGRNSFAAGAKLTVKGVSADANQRENCAIVLNTAKSMNASHKVLVANVETIIVESGMRNLTGGDRDSVGLYQQRPSQGWKGLRNREEACREFTSRAIPLDRQHPGWSSGQISQGVQRSAFPSRYDQQKAEAERWVAAFQGEVTPGRQTGASGSGGGYEFSRGADESSWDAVKRLADELQWRSFVQGTTVIFAPDSGLIKEPVAMRLTEHTAGVDVIDFDWDAGKKAARAQLTLALPDPGVLEPGMVVRLDDLGVANGKWLVGDVNHDYMSATLSVELVRPQPALPEPPDEKRTTGSGTSTYGRSGGASGKGSPGEKAVAWARHFVGRAYMWGGGHGPSGVAAMVAYGNAQWRSYTTGFDCSGLARCAWAQQGVDVGGTTTDQIARAQRAGIPHGSGTPRGGWQPGDLAFPHTGHVVIMTGKGVEAVEAMGKSWGIVSNRRGPAYFWCRWRGGAR